MNPLWAVLLPPLITELGQVLRDYIQERREKKERLDSLEERMALLEQRMRRRR